ncbi:hypothetical protein SAMN05192534_10714 [Alteribacillus persepolensis]|uniref:Uncharacterized protein n=1 Tax=Alteribacillus persepolensis TaxID=568899 RepID=A0A1G8D9N9_9BACI|nr:hypothetical protein [Alteribacillus persepolensis]SDH54382.1 hypothetical protein SAMN05192534_10714 [Alteribacillus persepolensis]
MISSGTVGPFVVNKKEGGIAVHLVVKALYFSNWEAAAVGCAGGGKQEEVTSEPDLCQASS